MRKYIGPIKWLGGIAVALFAFALVFEPLSRGLPEETRKSVLLHAIPFFATFVGILLLFILLIVMVAIRYNGKIPERTYQNIEITIILSIVVSVICLFQPWSTIPYRYGFVLLLGSTLGFIFWSHILPRNSREDIEEFSGLMSWQRFLAFITGLLSGIFFSRDGVLQLLGVIFNTVNFSSQPVLAFFLHYIYPIHGFLLIVASIMLFLVLSRTFNQPIQSQLPILGLRENALGGLMGILILVLLAGSLIFSNSPKAPYGLRERVFNSYNDERKAQVAAEASQEFQTVELPFLIIFSAFPALIIYFVAREAVGKRSDEQAIGNAAVAVGSATR